MKSKKEMLEQLRREEEHINKLKEMQINLEYADEFISNSEYGFYIYGWGNSGYQCNVKIDKKDFSDRLKTRITHAIRQEIKEIEEEIKKLESEW